MQLYERYPALKVCEQDITAALNTLIGVYRNGKKVLICGNGGSCSDSEHIVGELMKGFLQTRAVPVAFRDKLAGLGFADADSLCAHLQGALPAISLPSQAALLTAFANDVSPEMMYAQMVYGYGCEGDALICLSTSGNSQNVVNAAKIACAKGMQTLALTGARESALSALCDVTVKVPETETYKIQELHLPVYHYLCAEIERFFFGGNEQ